MSRRLVHSSRIAAAAVAVSCVLAPNPATPGTPAGYTEYIIPFDEDVFVYVTDPLVFDAIPANRTTAASISLTVWSDNTAIYVDHWEDGYEVDPDNPDAAFDEKYVANLGQTLNFISNPIPRPRTGADGNTYIGTPAGACVGQTEPAGVTIVQGNDPATDYCYDGRDYMLVVGGASTMTRGGWVAGTGGTNLGARAAIGEEVYPLAPQLIKYILPFGEGTPAGTSYERVIAVIQATEDNTELRLDLDGDGTFDSFEHENGYRTPRNGVVDGTVLTLQKGESYVLDRTSDGNGASLLAKDAVMLGSKTLQVEYFYGEDNSNYDTRAVASYPRGFWGNDYYAVVDGAGAGADTDILLYNPDLSATITMTWRTLAGSGTFTLGPTESALFSAKTGGFVPQGSSVYISGSDKFWGFSDIDVNSTAYDWGYSLMPDYLLSDEQTVAYAPGNIENDNPIDYMACNLAEGRDQGIFVTPVFDNTTFFIDKNGDGIPDSSLTGGFTPGSAPYDASIEVLRGTTVVAANASGGYTANRLESLYITGSNVGDLTTSDCNLTGARIWATGPFTMAYGENPDKASGAGGLDLGYTVLPNPGDWMDLVLTVDKATNPVVLSATAGVTPVTYTLVVQSHEFNVDAVSVVDTLPSNWAYQAGTTTITLPDLTTVSGASADPTVAGVPATGTTLSWGSGVLGSMLPNQTITITFQARTTANFLPGALTRNQVQATGTRTVGAVTQTFNARDFVFNTYQTSTVGLGITKASSVPEPTPVSPGDTLTYTVTVNNPASSTASLTNLWISDAIPDGTTYVLGSGQVSGCYGPANVRDEFATNGSYARSNGSQSWSAAWSETDTLAGGAASGTVLVTSNSLRFQYATGTANVRDEFDTAGSAAGNNGSVNWSTNWTETDSGNAGTNFNAGNIEIDPDGADPGRLEFQNTTNAGDFVSRSLNVTGVVGTATLSFDWDNNGIDGDDDILVQYSLDGGAFTTLLTQDGNDGDGPYSANIALTGANTTLTIRIFAEDDLEAPGGGSAEEARFDNVDVSYPIALGGPAANDRAARTANLAGATSATLTFSSLTSGTLDDGDVVQVWVDDDATFDGDSVLLESVINDNAFIGSYDISAYASANTTVFFVVNGGLAEAGEWRSFDNVDISYNAVVSPFASGFPPDFLDGATGCSVPPNRSVTLTFNVTVDDPFPTGQTQILNTATSAATEIPIPQSANARNIVVAPSSGSATVGDRVWLDADGDGVLDPGEAGLPGVEVTLKDQWGTPLQVTTTDSQGRYIFINVEPGTGYFVEVTGSLPAGLTQTTDARTDLRTNAFNLVDGQDYLNADLGFRASPGTATIGDTVWIDFDQDLFRDPGEVGLGGVTVRLVQDTDGDGVVDVGEPVIATRVTDASGLYLFTNITANGALDYIVTLDTAQPALTGYTATTITSFPYPNLPSLATRVDADFGFAPGGPTPATLYTITDRVWFDNGTGGGTASDGQQNGAEAGIAGVTVSLLNAAGVTIATTTTGANGNFSFTGVPGGANYTWRITDDDHVLADLYGTTTSALAGQFQMTGNLASNLDYSTTTPHFGYNATRAIGDTVWNDLDGDGVQDAGEPGIGGATVLLYRDDGDGNFEPGTGDTAVASLTTSATGFYLFSGLTNGTYWVSIDNTQAALVSYNSLTTADDDTTAAPGHQRLVPLSGAASRLDIDYGYRATTNYSLSGRLWNDANSNGADNTEPGFGGVTLELVRAGSVVATTTSAADGSYSFQGLPAGTYTVRFTDVNGVLTGFQTTFERTEGPLAGSYNGQETLTLGPSVSNVNFGFYNPFRPLTLAVVSSFGAHHESGKVAVRWETSAEIGTIGFDLYRYDRDARSYVQLNEAMLPSLIGSQQGGSYRFVDEGARPGETYFYLLVEVEASGKRNEMGPYRVNTDFTRQARAGQGRREAQVRSQAQRYERSPRVTRQKRAEARSLRSAWGRRTRERPRPRAVADEMQVKVAVPRTGIYYVPLAAAVEAGLVAGRTRLALSHNGDPVDFAPSGEGAGVYFYGRELDSTYATHDVYWLGEARGASNRMRVRRDRGASPWGGETFARTVHVEQDLMPSPHLFRDPEADWSLWDFMIGGFGSKSYAFRADAASGAGTAHLTVRLQGGSDTAAALDHRAIVRVNGQQLGEMTWDGLASSVATLDFDASLLVDGENRLEIEPHIGAGAPYSVIYIDSFDVTYDSLYRARDNQLECSTGDNASIQITGFTRGDVMVFDVTDPLRPVVVATEARAAADGTFGVALSAPVPNTRYFALTPDALVTGEVAPGAQSKLKDPANAAEYVIVTTPELKAAAQTLADYRGMPSLVVDIQDVYDEFGYGVSSPHALKAFLAYAWSRWTAPPRFVLLAGHGTFDYKDNFGYGGNLIPPAMVSTPDGLAPSDVWFADVDPSGLAPEIAIGRLPVQTPAELLDLIRKIQLREQLAGSAWPHPLVALADNPDVAGAFPTDSDRIMSLAAPTLPERIYLSELPVAAARERLLAAINEGAGMISYVGHAGYDVLADERLLSNADVAGLSNHEVPTVMTAMTCVAGDFASPFVESVAEALVRKPEGGAAAVWAPTWMSENDHAVFLAERYYGAVFGRRPFTIGEAVTTAMQDYEQTWRPQYMLQIYTLLGDPAMRLAW